MKYISKMLFVALLLVVSVAWLSSCGFAQSKQSPASKTAVAQNIPKLSNDELKKLVAPVALYPDDLLSNVLMAATVPDDVTAGANYLKAHGGKVTQMPSDDWDPSVKALLYTPDALYKLSDNMSWTTELGNAVVAQLNDVMSAIQDYRSQAVNSGNLKTSEQQTVTVEQNVVKIVPQDPDIIYVPEYDPVLAVTPGYPLLTFAAGVAVTSWWYNNHFDWYNPGIIYNPAVFGHYGYVPGGYYYNMWTPRPGYVPPGSWNPAVREDRINSRTNRANNRNDRISNRADNRNDRINTRIDDRNDRINNRIDNHGDRINNRGDRIDNRTDGVNRDSIRNNLSGRTNAAGGNLSGRTEMNRGSINNALQQHPNVSRTDLNSSIKSRLSSQHFSSGQLSEANRRLGGETNRTSPFADTHRNFNSGNIQSRGDRSVFNSSAGSHFDRSSSARSFSAPSRSFSAPSRSFSPPSGGGFRGGGGGFRRR